MNYPLNWWEGADGAAYTARNIPTAENIKNRKEFFDRILRNWRGLELPAALEVGANVGANVEALRRLEIFKQIDAVEPNDGCRAHLDRFADKTYKYLVDVKRFYDLILTCGLLIHIPEEHLDEMLKMMGMWGNCILMCEYFSPKREAISYQGKLDLCWKDDFGARFLQSVPQAEYVDSGFAWKQATGMDNLTWWLFKINH